MTFPSPFNGLFQAIAALLIFVVGYFALLLSVVVCLVTAALIYKGSSLFWSYVMRSATSAHLVPAEIAGDLRPARRNIQMMRHAVTPVRKSGI